MNDAIERMQALLSKFQQERVSVHLQRGGSDIVYTGVLRCNIKIDYCWKIEINRTVIIDPRTGQQQVLPKTQVNFFAGDVWCVTKALETPEEAKEALETMVSPIIT